MERAAASRGGHVSEEATRRALVGLALVVLGVVTVAALSNTGPPNAASASTPTAVPTRYELALGDSLAAGVGASSPTDGYVGVLYRQRRAVVPGLQLVNLACSGATTTSVTDGGGCEYPEGSQLSAAEAFLRAHRRDTAFVTIDIGINDVDGCMHLTAIDAACVSDGLREARSGLARILTGLRSAAPGVPLYGADYYDPFLAAWSQASSGQTVARQSQVDVLALDDVLSQVYGADDVPVAQVAARFDTVDFAASGTAGVPVNVSRICAWTWMCSQPNLHPNDAGHAAIAAAFSQVIEDAGGTALSEQVSPRRPRSRHATVRSAGGVS